MTAQPLDSRLPPPPSLANWSLQNKRTVLLFGSAAHNMRYGTISEYETHIRQFLSELKRMSGVRAQMVWLVGAANHVIDDEQGCRPENVSLAREGVGGADSHRTSSTSERAGLSHVTPPSSRRVAPLHTMSFHRSSLFSAVGAEAMRHSVSMLDMWKPTVDQGERCAKLHYDALYVPRDEGLVSRVVTNILVNLGCNARLLPDELLRRRV